MYTLDGAPSPADALLAASLTMSLLYTRQVHSPPSMRRMTAKASSTALLAAISAFQSGPRLLTAALLLGSAGDAFLAWDGDTAFLCGLGSFLSAHVLYIFLFAGLGHGKEFIGASTWRLAGASVLVCVFAPTMLSALIPRVARDLRAPIFVYTGAIVLMVLAALTVDVPLVVAGALAFTVSDAILSAEKFLLGPASKHRAWMPYAVWILYYSGQAMIALGSLEVLAR